MRAVYICVAIGCSTSTPEPADDDTAGTTVVDTPWGPQTVGYVVVDGHAIVDHDIDLGPIAQLHRRSIATPNQAKRWPDGVVTYWIDPDTIGGGSPNYYGIKNALRALQSQTPMRFVEAVLEPDTPHIKYRFDLSVPANTGFSGVGMQNDPVSRTVNVRFGAGSTLSSNAYLIQHETMHALGFWHEQSRPDRDTYVVYDNACDGSPAFTDNFGIHNDGIVSAPYDYFSIMHYGPGTFCKTTPGSPCASSCSTRADGTCCYPLVRVDGALSGGAPAIGGGAMSNDDVNATYLLYSHNALTTAGNARFGMAMAVADFDGDGYLDAAVGAPYTSVGDNAGAGAVSILRGTAKRLQPWLQITEAAVPGAAAEVNDLFGMALAAGDIDGDGRPELLIGSPGEDGGRGVVYVVRISGSGFRVLRTYTAADAGGIADPNDRFGTAVAFADLDGDGGKDVVVGAPYDQGTGTVHLLAVDSIGVVGQTKLLAGSAAGSRFGSTLAAADLDGDGRDDLAIGAPDAPGGGGVSLAQGGGATLATVVANLAGPGGNADYGTALVLAQSPSAKLYVGAPGQSGGRVYVYALSGFAVNLVQTLAQPVGEDEAGDRFGAALAVGGFLGAGGNDLAVGIPDENGGDGRVVVYDAGNFPGGAIYGAASVSLAGAAGSAFGRAVGASPVGSIAGRIYVSAPAAIDDLVVGAPNTAIPFPVLSHAGTIHTVTRDFIGQFALRETITQGTNLHD